MNKPTLCAQAQPIAHTQAIRLSSISLDETGNLIIPHGFIATFDAAEGPLNVAGKLINHGTIHVVSTDPARSTLTINAGNIENNGSIVSDLMGKLTISGIEGADLTITGPGTIESAEVLELRSSRNLNLSGATLLSSELNLVSASDVTVHAHFISAPVKVRACNLRIGVTTGDLTIADQQLDGDPVYFTQGGSLSLNAAIAPPTGGADYVAVATGNVSITGGIDTTGGTGPGRITLAAGVSFTTTGPNPITCTDCTLDVTIAPGAGTGTVTVTGNVNGKSTLEIRATTANFSAGRFTVAGNVTADGNLIVRPNAPLTVGGNIAAQGYVDIRTASTSFSTNNRIDISGTVTTPGKSVFLMAGHNVKVGTIDTSGGDGGGVVDIYANQGAGSATATTNFVIGGTGNANGVNGTVKIDTVSGGNSGNHFIHIFNGGTGGLRLTSMNDVSAKATAAKAGAVILNASFGDVTLPSGTLSLDGATSQAAGRIILAGNKVVATSGATTLSASDAGSGLQHFVWIAATEVNYGAAGLSIKADGAGPVPPTPLIAGVQFVSRGGITFTDNRNPVTPVITNSIGGIAQPVTFNGAGPLTVSSNGDNNEVDFAAYPIQFNGGTVDIQSNGNDKNVVLFRYAGTIPGGTASLEFLGGNVTVTSNGTNGSAGGTISVLADSMDTATPSVGATFQANGSGTGNGGNVEFDLSNSTIGFSATGPWFKLAANGGSTGSASGNGGTIKVHGEFNTSILMEDQGAMPAPSMVASPLGTNGSGGTIELIAGTLTVEGPPGTGPGRLVVDGVGTGNGGRIHIETTAVNSNPIILGNTGSPTVPLSAQLTLSAKSLGTGHGGIIEVTSSNTLTVDGGVVSVNAGINGNGGQISLQGAIINHGVVAGALNADGNGSGHGGSITMNATAGALTFGSGNFIVSAKSLGSGNGGKAKLTGTIVNIEPTSVTVAAGPSGNGNGGEIDGKATTGALTVTGALSANGQGSGAGGKIELESAAVLTAGGNVIANGGATGNGGVVGLDSSGLVVSGQLQANGGSTSGNGGTISILSKGNLPINIGGTGGFAVSAAALAAGNGGTVTITSAAGDVNIVNTGISVASNTNGNGGSLTVSAINNAVTLSGDFDLTGKAAGAGGVLTVVTNTALELVAPSTTIRANADPSGAGTGGRVSINKAKGSGVMPIDVNKVIVVNGGGALATTGFYGSITLNGKTCQQWKTGNSSFPKSYWDNITPTTGTAGLPIATGAALLHANMRLELDNHKVQIYAMESISEFNGFFGTNFGSNAAGVSLEALFVSAAFRTVASAGDNSAFMTGTIIHELGHQLDNHAWSNDAFSNPAWTNAGGTGARNLDEAAFNALPCATAVDADRIAHGLPVLCPTATGTNVQTLQTVLDMASDEQWARAFAEAVRAANSAQVSIPAYLVAVQARFSNENTYMNNVVTSGAP